MAALDTPYILMNTPSSQRGDPLDSSSLRPPLTPSRHASSFDDATPSKNSNPTYAAFSPTTLSATPATASAAKRRSTILVHQKSPLLLATPPQITRALAYSHPFLLPLNKFVGLISWTSGDPWESFLVVAAWWAIVLYGDIVIRLAGPMVLALALIAGMYGRRYSPLSSSGWSDDTAAPRANMPKGKSKGKNATTSTNGAAGAGSSDAEIHRGHSRTASHTRHQKTLDEIVETLKQFTTRCNVLLEPLLELTDFLSTQRTATSATTRPALTALFVRILVCAPFWAVLTLPPLRIVTARRVVLVVGTVGLTWHARVMRASRTILWRSATVRRLAAMATGLRFEGRLEAAELLVAEQSDLSTTTVGSKGSAAQGKAPVGQQSELTKAIRRARGENDAGVRFTFIIYENQRRWVGLGWTTSLFAYERPAWTDEHNNAVPPRDQFELPEVDDGNKMRWRWVECSRWKVDGVADEAVKVEKPDDDGTTKEEWDYDGSGGKMGWVFYDNKWQHGRRGQDGWGRWARRRKWYRDAELVEADLDDADNANSLSDDRSGTPTSSKPPSLPPRPSSPAPSHISGSPIEGQSMPNIAEHATAGDKEEDDAVSILSTSSRSMRFKAPSLRRRVTDSGRSNRSRRASEAASEEDVEASLGTKIGLEIQGAGNAGWGVGDEARMGLE